MSNLDRLVTELQETGQMTSLGTSLALLVNACETAGLHPGDTSVIGVVRVRPDMHDEQHPATSREERNA